MNNSDRCTSQPETPQLRLFRAYQIRRSTSHNRFREFCGGVLKALKVVAKSRTTRMVEDKMFLVPFDEDDVKNLLRQQLFTFIHSLGLC